MPVTRGPDFGPFERGIAGSNFARSFHVDWTHWSLLDRSAVYGVIMQRFWDVTSTLMMEVETVSETLDYNSILTRLIAREVSIGSNFGSEMGILVRSYAFFAQVIACTNTVGRSRLSILCFIPETTEQTSMKSGTGGVYWKLLGECNFA
jgi:hypothetical protein